MFLSWPTNQADKLSCVNKPFVYTWCSLILVKADSLMHSRNSLSLQCPYGPYSDPNLTSVTSRHLVHCVVCWPLWSPHRFKTLGAGPTRRMFPYLVFQNIRPYQCSNDNFTKMTHFLEFWNYHYFKQLWNPFLDTETTDFTPVHSILFIKLSWALCLISGKHPTFFIWNLIVERTSSTFCTMLSLCVSAVGNLPALFRPGPRIRGICLMRLSEARKASYFLAEN